MNNIWKPVGSYNLNVSETDLNSNSISWQSEFLWLNVEKRWTFLCLSERASLKSKWRRDQLDATIGDLLIFSISSTCLACLYTHHQESRADYVLLPTVLCSSCSCVGSGELGGEMCSSSQQWTHLATWLAGTNTATTRTYTTGSDTQSDLLSWWWA
jgi:hypothetical protein